MVASDSGWSEGWTCRPYPVWSPNVFSEELRKSMKGMGTEGNRKDDEAKNKLSFLTLYKGQVFKYFQTEVY